MYKYKNQVFLNIFKPNIRTHVWFCANGSHLGSVIQTTSYFNFSTSFRCTFLYQTMCSQYYVFIVSTSLYFFLQMTAIIHLSAVSAVYFSLEHSSRNTGMVWSE